MIKILFLTISIVYSFPSKCFVIPKPPKELESILMPDIIKILEIPTSTYTSTITSRSTVLEIPTSTTITHTSTLPTTLPTSTFLEIPTLTPTPTSILISTQISIPTSTLLEISTPTSILISTPTPTPIFTSIDFDKKQLILDLHNNERELKNVTNKVTWSNSLESTANDLSNILANKGCPLQHSLGKGVFAQNLYGAYGTITPNFKNAINAWISEKNLIGKPGISFSDIGHYLIMVSSKYNNVGCSTAINFIKRCYVVTCDYR
jgi:uncharacterized protein YkwD